MKVVRCLVAGVVAAVVSGGLYGAGFALYEGSTKGIAMGGAVMGVGVDAAANFYNPATISDFTNTVVTVGTGIETPHANAKVDGRRAGKMDPGCFLLPHAAVVQPLPYGFTLGLGFAPEFGLGTRYRNHWPLDFNTTETTVRGFVINPNLAYRVTDDWSVSAGFRILYFDFEQYSNPQAVSGGKNYGRLRTHIKGDNGFADFGWQVSTRYKIRDNLSVGLTYKSYIDTKVRGDYSTRVNSYRYDYSAIAALAGTPYYAAAQQQVRNQIQQQVDAGARKANGDAAADIRLPQSLIAGVNWDPVETVHLGAAVTWTGWSSMDAIHFRLEGGDKTTKLDWDDVFRFSFGGAWDFAEDWTLLGSYIFDMDPCKTKRDVGSTMLPAGDRHILSCGLAWRWRKFEVAACYGIVFMTGEGQTFTDSLGTPHHFKTTCGLSHQIGATLSYYF